MKQISFRTNCGFFLSRYDGKLAGSLKPILDKKIKKFLDENFNSGIKITVKLLPKKKPKHFTTTVTKN